MAEAARNWAPPQWVPYKKHRPPPGVAWTTLVRDTGKPEGEAFYHPRVTVAEQEQMEMACIAPARLFREIGHKRMYFSDMGHIIGASSGEQTQYLYVEHLTNGQVHGRPATADDLRRKGAVL